MEKKSKVIIYQGIIEYLLEETNYSLKNIAALTNSSIKSLREIYLYSEIPRNFQSEIQLVKLFEMILEIQTKNPASKYFLNKQVK